MRSRCFFTVRTVMKRCVATSAFVLPPATHASTISSPGSTWRSRRDGTRPVRGRTTACPLPSSICTRGGLACRIREPRQRHEPRGCDTTHPADTLCLHNVFVQHPYLEGLDGIVS